MSFLLSTDMYRCNTTYIIPQLGRDPNTHMLAFLTWDDMHNDVIKSEFLGHCFHVIMENAPRGKFYNYELITHGFPLSRGLAPSERGWPS